MKKGVATTLIWIVAGVLAVGLLAQTLRNRSHNEQMYVTAGALLAQGERLYTDFAFVQTPYAPQVYALAYRLTGADNLLGKAKLINYGFLLLAAGALLSGLAPGNARRIVHGNGHGALFRQLLFAARGHRGQQLHDAAGLEPARLCPVALHGGWAAALGGDAGLRAAAGVGWRGPSSII